MPVERHRSPVAITTTPRTTIAPAHHKEIDAILKDLKSCSRCLKTALDSLKDELRVLERLYYKNKNQHRVSLFFKRVSEMRRCGRRLSDLNISERVDLLRASFVGLEHTNDQKALRGSWAHVPEQPCVDLLTERLMACSALVCEMRARLESAYNHFTLAMQTGAFVQLIILLVAISSRMFVLSSEVEDALQLGISSCDRLSRVIRPAGAQQRPSHIDHDAPSEDRGQLISLQRLIDIPVVVVGDMDVRMETTSEVRLMPPSGTNCIITKAPKKTVTKAAEKPHVKKTKKKLDEIDEIFGF